MAKNNKTRTINEILNDLETITEEVFTKYQNDINPAHQLDHVKRVMAAVDKILDFEPEANVNLARIAAILHDIGRSHKEGDHSLWSAEIAKDILLNKFSEEEIKMLNIKIDELVKIIKFHSKRPEEVPSELRKNLEWQILTDADKIDSFGPIGIIRASLDGRFQKSYQDQIDHIKAKANPDEYRLLSEGGLKVGRKYKEYLNEFLIDYNFQKDQFLQ